jgi:hypothetical protein
MSTFRVPTLFLDGVPWAVRPFIDRSHVRGWYHRRLLRLSKPLQLGTVLVDCETELPIAANVSAGNVHDSKRASNVLSEARWTTRKFRPRHFIADNGYATKALFRLVRRQYRANPVIDIPSGYVNMLAREGIQASLPGHTALKAQRVAVERVFSRLKGQRSLNHITTRRRWKATAHCYLALITLQSSSLPSPSARHSS